MSSALIDYLKWYYETNVWKRLHYHGVRALKLSLDMWNYQERMFENDIHWVIETGTRRGGSALFFADLLAAGAREGWMVSVDVTHEALHPLATTRPRIRLLLGDSADPATMPRVKSRREHAHECRPDGYDCGLRG